MVVAVLALAQEYLVLSLCAISAHPSLNYTFSCKKSSLKTLVSSLQEEVKKVCVLSNVVLLTKNIGNFPQKFSSCTCHPSP